MNDANEKVLVGASLLTDVLCRLQKERGEIEAMCHEDVMLPDGTVLFSRERHIAIRDELDKTIAIFRQHANLRVGA